MKLFLNEQTPGGVYPSKAPLFLKQNIENTVKNYQEKSNFIPDIFSTNVFVEFIFADK